jgi:hypothetical protein
MGVVIEVCQWLSFKFDPWDTKFPGSGTEI